MISYLLSLLCLSLLIIHLLPEQQQPLHLVTDSGPVIAPDILHTTIDCLPTLSTSLPTDACHRQAKNSPGQTVVSKSLRRLHRATQVLVLCAELVSKS